MEGSLVGNPDRKDHIGKLNVGKGGIGKIGVFVVKM